MIIFDLDGTLVDSSPGILDSYAKALDELGIHPKQPLTSEIVGPPLLDTLAMLAGTQEPSELRRLSECFKSYYDSVGYSLLGEYHGIAELLDALTASGQELLIATNKRLLPTRRILEYLKWTKYFSGVYCSDGSPPRLCSKSEMLATILNDYRLPPHKAIYVGDRQEDAKAALENSIPFCFALWGYGNTKHDAASKDYQLLNHPRQLLELV